MLTHRLHTFPSHYDRHKASIRDVDQMRGKRDCIEAQCESGFILRCYKRVLNSGPVAQRLVQGTHGVSCAIRMETSYGMVSNSAKSKRVKAHDNAEPSGVYNSEGVET